MKNIQLDEIKPSRIYSWVYVADVNTFDREFNKGGRAGTPPNPLYGHVSARKVFAGQAATAEMYRRAWEKLNPGKSFEADDSYTKRFTPTENPCVVKSLATGDLQVRILNPETGKVEYFVDGQPASAEQIEIIKIHKRSHSRPENSVKLMFPYVPNLLNVVE